MSPEVAIQIGLTKIDDVTYRAGTPDNQHYITTKEVLNFNSALLAYLMS